MPTFRKISKLVTAEQFLEGRPDPPGVYRSDVKNMPYVITIHGAPCPIVHGDWIVPEPDGKHYYPIKDEIFRAEHEPFDATGGASEYASTERIKQLRHDAQEILKYEGELRQELVSQQEFCPAMFTRRARDLAKAFLHEHPEKT